jgi:hypothetical protein
MSWLLIVIRTSGGSVVGLGYVRRCLTLEEELVRPGVEVQFLCDGAPGLAWASAIPVCSFSTTSGPNRKKNY